MPQLNYGVLSTWKMNKCNIYVFSVFAEPMQPWCMHLWFERISLVAQLQVKKGQELVQVQEPHCMRGLKVGKSEYIADIFATIPLDWLILDIWVYVVCPAIQIHNLMSQLWNCHCKSFQTRIWARVGFTCMTLLSYKSSPVTSPQIQTMFPLVGGKDHRDMSPPRGTSLQAAQWLQSPISDPVNTDQAGYVFPSVLSIQLPNRMSSRETHKPLGAIPHSQPTPNAPS